MKSLLLLLFMISINKACTQQNELHEPISISYSATTRGSSFVCSLDSTKITVSSQGRSEKSGDRNLNEEEWNQIMELLKKIPIDSIANFKAPSSERSVDRVATVSLLITANNKEYESDLFDEGNPPKELEPLIDRIKALSKTVE